MANKVRTWIGTAGYFGIGLVGGLIFFFAAYGPHYTAFWLL
jgi:hypothetical protein